MLPLCSRELFEPHLFCPGDATASVFGSCTGVAGNSTGASYGFKYDATAPAGVHGVASRAPDSNGWYNHAFDVVFTGNDAVSRIDSCTESTYSGPDDATVTSNGSCTDVAGNTSNASFGPVKYDGTGAEVTIDGSTAQIVTAGDSLTGDGTDNLSGVARVVVTFQPALGGEPIRRTADCVSECCRTAARWTVSTDGLLGGYDVTAVATDVAGNEGPASATVALTVLSP